jgi:hypothetical protein
MKKTLHQWRESGIDKRMFKKWLTDRMSDFTSPIATKVDYEVLIQNKNDKDINKVILFTEKEQVPNVYKALSAEFRDKLRFSVVSLPKGKASDYAKELADDYIASNGSLPRIVVE